MTAPIPADRPVLLSVCRSGGGYNPDWVWALKRAANRVAPEFRFVCLTDFPSVAIVGDNRGLRNPKLAGYWSLINWFAPGQFAGRVVAVGLDTLLIGSLADLAAYKGPAAGISDFYRPDVLASGVMTWEGDELAHVWERFHADARDIMRSHPRMDPWLRKQIPNAARLQDVVPNQIVSYKAHCDARRGPPKDARIVCFHGRPSITDLKVGTWARDEWETI